MRKLSNIMPFFVCAVLLVLFLYLGLLGMAYMFPVESDGGRHANVVQTGKRWTFFGNLLPFHRQELCRNICLKYVLYYIT